MPSSTRACGSVVAVADLDGGDACARVVGLEAGTGCGDAGLLGQIEVDCGAHVHVGQCDHTGAG